MNEGMGLVDRFERDLELLATDAFCPDPFDLLLEQRTLLLPPEKISTTECAERYRYVKSSEGGGKQRWSRDLTPYVVGPQEALDDQRYRFVVIVGPGRTGKSLCGENHLLKRLRNGPSTDVIIYMISTSDIADYADKEFRDFVSMHEEVHNRIRGYPKESPANKRTFKRVGEQAVQLLPASPTKVRQKQAPFIWATEIDGYKPRVRDGFKDNIATRMQVYGNQAKALIESHPDCGWTSGIAPIWKDSTRGLWYWECPDCKGWSSPHPLAKKGLHMRLHIDRPDGLSDDELLDHVEREAGLLCPHCGTVHDEQARIAMIGTGRWVFAGETIDEKGKVTGSPRESDTAGFWIHGTMSPFIGIGELVRKYVAALVFFEKTRKPERLKEVMVKTLGEVYEGGGDTKPVDPQALMQRPRGFHAKTVTEQVRFITASVDVGGAKFDILLRGWDLEGRSWIIDRYTIVQNGDRRISPPERQDDWLLLERFVLNRLTPIMDGNGEPTGMALPVAAMAVDLQGSEGVTPKAREFSRLMSANGQTWGSWQKVRLIRGGSSKNAPEVPARGRKVSVDDEGRAMKPEIFEWTLNVDKLRFLEFERLAVEDDGPGAVYFGEGLPRAAFEELAGEQWQDGKWVRHGNNETLDLLGYAEAARQMLKPERSTIQWFADEKGPARLPIWAKPVSVGENADGEIKPVPPVKPEKSLYARYDALNSTPYEER